LRLQELNNNCYEKESTYRFYFTADCLYRAADFIHFANDHKECEDTVRHYINGNAVVEKEHICKEKFSL
jgi:hypothetical protein